MAKKAEATKTPTRLGGDKPLSTFVEELGFPEGFAKRDADDSNQDATSAIDWLGTKRPQRQNHWPALCLAVIAQAEGLLKAEQVDSLDGVFASHPVKNADENGNPINTLNFEGPDGDQYRLRPLYNKAMDVVRVEMRREHPSNAAHATQSWPAYKDFISDVFRTTPGGRLSVACHVWEEGVLKAKERRWAESLEREVRPFELVLVGFDTKNAQPGGALFQALVFGYFRADSPSLTWESHSVNTASSRADMPGDIAGFRGQHVEMAVEVKDTSITSDDVETVLSDFLEDLAEMPNVTAVVVAADVDAEARSALESSNVIALSRDDLRARVMTWDLPKQQEALRGCSYFLGRIQKRSGLQERLTEFLNSHGLSHDGSTTTADA